MMLEKVVDALGNQYLARSLGVNHLAREFEVDHFDRHVPARRADPNINNVPRTLKISTLQCRLVIHLGQFDRFVQLTYAVERSR